MARTILVADDSVTIRRVVELTFAETDIRVETVGSGLEALERFETLRPDLVLVDVVMPDPSGYEICERVKGSDRAVPVVLLAGTFEPFDPERAQRCGADGHVVKPFDSRALVQLVERLLEMARVAPVEAEAETAPEGGSEAEVEAAIEDIAAEDPEIADLPERAGAGAASTRSELPAEVLASPETEEMPGPGALAEEAPLDERQIDAIARRVVERLSDRVLREIAWDVVPDLAETIIRERLDEIERGRT